MSFLSLNFTDVLNTIQGASRGRLTLTTQNLQGLNADQVRKTLFLIPQLALKPEIGGLLLVLLVLVSSEVVLST